MCENAKAALEIIKQKKSNLTKGEIVVVFQQVVYDLNKQGERMTELEKRMTSLEEKTDKGFAAISEQIKDLKKTIEDEHKTFWDRIPLLKDVPNLAWFLLIIIVCVLASLMGANLDFLKDSLQIGG